MELKPRDLLPFPIFLSPRGFGVSFSQFFLGNTPNPGARTLPPPSEPRNAQKFHKNANFPKEFLIFRTRRFLCSALPILSREIPALNAIFLLFHLHKKSFSLLFLHFPFSPLSPHFSTFSSPFLPFPFCFLPFSSLSVLFFPLFLPFFPLFFPIPRTAAGPKPPKFPNPIFHDISPEREAETSVPKPSKIRDPSEFFYFFAVIPNSSGLPPQPPSPSRLFPLSPSLFP